MKMLENGCRHCKTPSRQACYETRLHAGRLVVEGFGTALGGEPER